jgi:threonine-phosphate decarboxylase
VEPALLREILSVCGETGSRLFLDECFLDLCDRRDTLTDLLAGAPRLTLLRAFTKSFGMAGLRLGYCLTSDAALLRKMSRAVQPWNVSVPAQAAGIAALDETAYLDRARALVRKERPYLAAALTELGLTVVPSESNFLLFSGPRELDAALRDRGIAVRSCENFHGLGPGWYRAAVRSRAESDAFLSALAEILGKG